MINRYLIIVRLEGGMWYTCFLYCKRWLENECLVYNIVGFILIGLKLFEEMCFYILYELLKESP